MMMNHFLKGNLKRFAAFLIAAGLCVCAARAEETENMMNFGDIKLTKSYKNTNENNPLYTQRFGADPGVMEYNGRVYVYTTNDVVEYDRDGNVIENTYGKINKINCISSDDLVNWTDHGAIPVAGPEGIAKWASCSWAPCAAHKTINGKEQFFLYFCNGGNGIGVLVADDPAGPFRDDLGHLLITRTTPNCANVLWLFDPAVMVDEDGTGYLAFGGGVPNGKDAMPGTTRIARLGEDMISLDCDPVAIEAPYVFEDSGINKINGKYVYSYCSNWNTTGNTLGITNGAIEYMVADDPMGPYTYGGEFFKNIGNFFGLYGNNHHSIVSLNGQWYLFYHARPVEQRMKITGNYRSPMVNKLTVTADAQVLKVSGTMRGVPQLKGLDPFTAVRAATMSDQAGVNVRGYGETIVTEIDRGDWIKVSGVTFDHASARMTIRARSEQGCVIRVARDGSVRGTVVCEITVPAGESFEAYTVPAEVTSQHDLYFIFSASCEMESWCFE